jgi:hypothetical protein
MLEKKIVSDMLFQMGLQLPEEESILSSLLVSSSIAIKNGLLEDAAIALIDVILEDADKNKSDYPPGVDAMKKLMTSIKMEKAMREAVDATGEE